MELTTLWFALIAIYLTLFAALLSALNAFIRYGVGGLIWLDRNYGGGGIFAGFLGFYGRHSNAFLEGQWYMFAGMVMLGAAWTLKINEHVRVDLVYSSMSESTSSTARSVSAREPGSTCSAASSSCCRSAS